MRNRSCLSQPPFDVETDGRGTRSDRWSLFSKGEVDEDPSVLRRVMREAGVPTAMMAIRFFLLQGRKRSRQGGTDTIWREYTARKARTDIKATQKYRLDTTWGNW